MNNKFLKILFRLLFTSIIPLITLIHISLNKYHSNVHIIKTIVDDKIPFVNYFAVPYLLMFFYIATTLVFFAIADSSIYFGLLTSIVSGMLICFAVYYFYPTTVLRPFIHSSDFFSRLVLYIYSRDNPYNCFPSIHVLSAYLPFLFAFKYNKSTFMKVFTSMGFISITLSTMFIKQHYFPDAVASIILGTSMYFLFSREFIWSRIGVELHTNLKLPS